MSRQAEDAATKIDLGPDCHDWQPAADLGKQIGVTGNASIVLANAITKGPPRVNGYTVERRELEEGDEAPKGTKYVYRVKREGVDSTAKIADRAAAAREAEMQALRAELEATSLQCDALAKAVDKRDSEILDLRATVTELEDELDTARRSVPVVEVSQDVETICLGDSKPTYEAVGGVRATLIMRDAPPPSVPRRLDTACRALWDILNGFVVENSTDTYPETALQALRAIYEDQ